MASSPPNPLWGCHSCLTRCLLRASKPRMLSFASLALPLLSGSRFFSGRHHRSSSEWRKSDFIFFESTLGLRKLFEVMLAACFQPPCALSLSLLSLSLSLWESSLLRRVSPKYDFICSESTRVLRKFFEVTLAATFQTLFLSVSSLFLYLSLSLSSTMT